MSYVFFTSYARENADRSLRKFVTALAKQVRDKTGFSEEAIEFFDTTSIETGEDWERALARALGSSKVIVCLCSPHYFNSEFCGKELKVFLRRRGAWLEAPGHQGRQARVIFPVIWEKPLGPMPEVVSQFQYDEHEYPRKYLQKGLHALALLGGERDNFLKVVIALAESIRSAIRETELPELQPPPSFQEVANAFAEVKPPSSFNFGVVFLHPEGGAWRPFSNASNVRDVVEQSSSKIQRSVREIPAGAGLYDRLTVAARCPEAVLILTSWASLQSPDMRLFLDQWNQQPLSNCAFLLVWDIPVTDSAVEHLATESALQNLLPATFGRNRLDDWFSIRSPEALAIRVAEVQERLRLSLIEAAPARRVTDEVLRQGAREVGIAIDEHPAVAGPGGAT